MSALVTHKLITVTNEEKEGENYLIPAWTVYGYVEAIEDEQLCSSQYSHWNGGLMTINAIDGSLLYLNNNHTLE